MRSNLPKESMSQLLIYTRYIFNQGETAEVMYIITNGKVAIETIIEIDEFNRYPIVSFRP